MSTSCMQLTSNSHAADGHAHQWQDDGTGVSGLDHELPLLHSLRGNRSRGDLGGIITEGAGPYLSQQTPSKWVTPSGDASIVEGADQTGPLLEGAKGILFQPSLVHALETGHAPEDGYQLSQKVAASADNWQACFILRSRLSTRV